jgi:hypothetical protein
MDITLCEGTNCPLKDQCFRHTAKPSEYQSYFTVVPFKIKNNEFKCHYLWTDNNEAVINNINSILKGEGDK